jgi:glyoxylase-like metal-dependent hydrolase (beta-lactamase superfamily II)
MPLYASVYVAPPISFTAPNGKPGGLWSPISSTLIHTTRHAVLVDTPITKSQTQDLIAFIEKTLHPGAQLKYIYITHGHGDHWFGINMLLKRFPGAKAVATKGTIEHMKTQIVEGSGAATGRAGWLGRFPGQIDEDFVLAEPLDGSGKFYLPTEDGKVERGIEFRAVEVGHSDTHDSTVLFVPDLKLVVAGDVVYGDVHQMLAEANTHALRMEWVRAIETIMALKPTPEIVVPGHMKADEIPGAWHLENSRRYILEFDRLVASGRFAKAKDLVGAVKKHWPTRFNDGALVVGAISALKVREEEARKAAKGGKL